MAKSAKRSRQSRRAARLDFAAIEIAGALLPPEIVTRAAAFDMPEQSDEGYGVLPGLKLRDKIARYYQIALAHWERFSAVQDGNVSAPQRFVLDLLTDCFGFANIAETGPVILSERRFPIRHASHDGRVPIVIAPLAPAESRKAGIDEAIALFGDETRRRSATQLLQEYLNADEDALWGVASDGCTLRFMRDNLSLTRPAWIEANLEKILNEGLFADFSALWLVIHASRFGAMDASPSDCPLERWCERGRIDGSAAKEKLRLGVEAALIELGAGFLENPANADLRDALITGKLTRQAYYEELLRLVYRLIFLFAAEDRGLLHTPNAPDATRKAYRQGYAVGRLRERCTRNTSLDRHHDAWEGLRALFDALAKGETRLWLAALGGLFISLNLADLTRSRIANRRLLKAIWHLSWFRPNGQPMTRVNWRDMQTEELGSVYESLLELIPVVHLETRDFAFTVGDAANKGNERKTTGSYYTPDSLVQLLLTTTLDPVLDAAESRNPSDPAAEILKLSIIDPACGSGHFLLAAARRAAARIARHRSEGAPSQEAFQHALREVVSNCIFGADRNPMAVELCKVALWIEALEPGKPLSFLDARIRCGDSLIGVFDYGMLRAGLPDEAFNPLTGDNKAVAKAYKAINKQQRDGVGASGLIKELSVPASITDGAARVLAMPEDTLEEIEAKSRAWDRLLGDPRRLALKTACDMYVTAFLLPKTGDVPDPRYTATLPLPTTEAVWRTVRGGSAQLSVHTVCKETAQANRVFHWPLEFPAVMARGGFDAVIGNPSWEVSQLSDVEFFSSRDPHVAALQGNDRKTTIKRLREDNPRLWEEFNIASRAVEAANTFFRSSGRFPLTASGKINTYPLFAEHFARLARATRKAESAKSIAHVITDTGGVCPPASGRAGVILPTGIATDSSTSAFFGDLIARNRLSALYDFENREGIFPGVHRSYKFSILAIGPSPKARFATFLLNTQALEEKERQIELELGDFKLMNPNTLTAPLFRSRADLDLTRKLYGAAPVLIREREDQTDGDENPWGITFQQGLYNMTSASEFFRTVEQLSDQGFCRDGANWWHEDGRVYVPLYEAKMIHHFDHRFGSYAGLNSRPADGTLPETPDSAKASPDYEADPWYWVPEDETGLRVARVPSRLKQYFRKENAEGCLKVLAEWVLGTLEPGDLEQDRLARTVPIAEKRLRDVLGERALQRDIVGVKIAAWLGKAPVGARKMQRETPLRDDDLAFIRNGPSDPLELTGALIDRKQPRWLMGWRDICRSTDERTVIASVFPRMGVGHTLPMAFAMAEQDLTRALVAQLASLPFDYAAPQKLAGTHMTYFYLEQLPVLAPQQFSQEDISFITPGVLELTYTSHAMRPWAEDLGHVGAPFAFAPDRRAQLRAELDAFFARKYNLTRDELRYILDPSDTHGESYPSETFRGLKRNEIERYGEYRTQRLVLEAFDRLMGA